MITLRPDQQDFKSRIRASMRRHKSVLGMAPTGFGKTRVAVSIVADAVAKGRRVIFAVHRDELMKQTSKALEDLQVPHGSIASDMPYSPAQQVHVASIMTLAKRLDAVAVPHLLAVDEAHLSRAKTWQTVIDFYRQRGAYVLGLSGSPQRLDGKGLKDLFDDLVLGPSTAELMAAGHLCQYRYFRGEAPVMPDRSAAGDFTQSTLDIANDGRLVGNIADRWLELASDRRTVCFTVSHEHSRSIIEEFQARGVRAASISSKTRKGQDREKIIREFADGEIRVLCNVELITTGFDLAAQVGREVTVNGIIMARPTWSLALYLQMVGRGLRAAADPCMILDHAGNSLRHGYPDDPRDWPLLWGGGKPAALPRPPLDCDRCLCQVRQPAPSHCPHCGAEWKSSSESKARAIEYDEAKRLIEVTAAERERERVEKLQAQVKSRREEASCRTLEDWQKLGAARGYEHAERWAARRFELRQQRSHG